MRPTFRSLACHSRSRVRVCVCVCVCVRERERVVRVCEKLETERSTVNKFAFGHQEIKS